jgi:hypothetical protein
MVKNATYIGSAPPTTPVPASPTTPAAYPVPAAEDPPPPPPEPEVETTRRGKKSAEQLELPLEGGSTGRKSDD